MKKLLRILLASALVLLPLSEALAGSSTITTKDASGATKTFFVTTDGGGNFYAAGVICDQSAAAACASVGTAGSPSTNALTVQAVTLGHGTAANAMRVELPTDGTGLVNAAQSGTWNIGTLTTVTGVTTVSTVTNLAQMNGAALLMGNGVTGTGSQRVTIASDNTAFSVNATVVNANANGSATSANSSPTVIASDQAAVAVKGNAANGAAVSGNPNLVAGSDGTNARSIATDTSGNVKTINGAGGYETVAASQTGQAMGATGGTGDYLSHCVIYPQTTTPGVVTVFDNTNAAATNAISFPGGASSVSNLAPVAVPVGAVSTAGAWKVTTGANVIVTCYGRFT